MRASVQIIESVFPEQRFKLAHVARPLLLAGSLCLCTLIAVGLIGAGSRAEKRPIAALRAAGVVKRPILRIRGAHLERGGDFLLVQGEATNLTARDLKNAEAVVEFFDSSGRLCKVESSLLEITDLRPGEESPFRVQTRDQEDIASYRLRFHHLLGPTIPATEALR